MFSPASNSNASKLTEPEISEIRSGESAENKNNFGNSSGSFFFKTDTSTALHITNPFKSVSFDTIITSFFENVNIQIPILSTKRKINYLHKILRPILQFYILYDIINNSYLKSIGMQIFICDFFRGINERYNPNFK